MGNVRFLQNYHDACEYINAIEKRKILESGKKIWSFIRRRYETLVLTLLPQPIFERFFDPQRKGSS